jgi:wyosine [tRNA(Phe)-imidazoG37] synthetase (radical SAM superfamily)
MTSEIAPTLPQPIVAPPASFSGPAFGCLRQFLGNRFVYAVVSPRAHGLSIGVNLNPNKSCNFDCEYCEVDRTAPSFDDPLDVDVMAGELQYTLSLVYSGELQNVRHFQNVPADLLKLQQVALSGDGEPTLSPYFLDAVRAVVHIRALGKFPFFKIVLVTNASGLDLPHVQDGLKLFTQEDEIWAKLEAGTQHYMEEVNRPDCLLDKILDNILLVARRRPVIIQSLFPLLNHEEPSAEEIEQYTQRLRELKQAGAQIPLVQIYSASRPAARAGCGHLPLKSLSRIAQYVRESTGLKAEVF